jgi:hypothetical protein
MCWDRALHRRVRSNELSTKRSISAVYIRRGSARVFIGVAAIVVTARFLEPDFGRGDLIAIAFTVVIIGTVEWVVHKYLLHAADDAWTTRKLGIGVGHKQHHLDPHDIDWLMLGGVDAAVFIVGFGIVTAAWSFPVMYITGSALIGPFLTAWALAAIGLGHYEWVHLMVHTRYRPTTRYYARLARNHRWHHYRNENYWLGVTTNSGDRLLRTYPADKAAVPLSETARTLT